MGQTPSMLAERYGVAGCATLAGLLSAVLTVTRAFAPWGAAWVRTVAGSYPPVTAVSAARVLGAVGLLALGRAVPAVGAEDAR